LASFLHCPAMSDLDRLPWDPTLISVFDGRMVFVPEGQHMVARHQMPGSAVWTFGGSSFRRNFCSEVSWRTQPRVSTLGTAAPERFALKLKGRQIERTSNDNYKYEIHLLASCPFGTDRPRGIGVGLLNSRRPKSIPGFSIK
jgi:hypothetical protein